MTGTLTDRWNDDEPSDPTAGQPDEVDALWCDDMSVAPRNGTIILVTGCNNLDRVWPAAWYEPGPEEDGGTAGWVGMVFTGLCRLAAPKKWRPMPYAPR